MDQLEEAPEHYEHHPWSALTPVRRDRTMQLVGLVFVIVAALLALLVVIRPNASVETATPPSAETPLATEAAVASPVVQEAPAVASEPPPTPQAWSEADLMAAIPQASDFEAATRAEWFVTDFFTVDGEGVSAVEAVASFPDAVEMPIADGSAVSYVEWARALQVVRPTPVTSQVTVLFRTLVGDHDGGFVRTPVRAVSVLLREDDSGYWGVVDLPAVVALPVAVPDAAWPVSASPPSDVVALGMEQAGFFGTGPELEQSGVDGDGWRLVFRVVDASGFSFPVVVRPEG